MASLTTAMSVGEPRPERSKTHDTILLYRPIQKQCTQIQLKEYFFIYQLHANSNAGFGKLVALIILLYVFLDLFYFFS